MNVKVHKWGNSLGIRIPKVFADTVNIKKESTVNLSFVEGKIIITPVSEPEYKLEDLLSTITEKNIHKEFSTGEPAGKEIW
jgi:antitoxin MazE